MEVSEREIEEYIDANVVTEILKVNHGHSDFKGIGVRYQVDMGEYGRADIVVDYEYKYEDVWLKQVMVIELKVVALDSKCLNQLCRYLAYVQGEKGSNGAKVRGVLIGPEFKDCEDVIYIVRMIDDVDIFYYDINLARGLCFHKTDIKKHGDMCKKHAML